MKFQLMGDSCNIDDKGSSCCSPAKEEKSLGTLEQCLLKQS